MQKYQQIAVSGFISHNGKALVVRRSNDNTFLPRYWETAGGKLEWGEDPTLGLIREVKEEVGLMVRPLRPYRVWDYVDPGLGRHLVEVAMLCKVTGGAEVTLSAEHQEYRWITEDEVESLAPITDGMREVIAEGFALIKE